MSDDTTTALLDPSALPQLIKYLGDGGDTASVAAEAVAYWRQNELVSYSVPTEDNGCLSGKRPTMPNDAIKAVLLMRLGIAPAPEHFSSGPEFIWLECEDMIFPSLEPGEYEREAGIRIGLAAKEHLAQHAQRQ